MNDLFRQISKCRDAIRRTLARWLFDKPLIGGKKDNFKRILVIRWDAKYGDSFVSSFFYREIKKHLPHVSVEAVIPQHMEDLYLNSFHVDKVYFSDKRPGFKALKKLANHIGQTDLVIHLPEALKPRDMYFIKQLQPRFFAGQDDELIACNIKLGKNTEHKHFSEKFVAILEGLGMSRSAVDTRYIIPESSERRLCPTEWSEGKLRFVLNPFGNSQRRCLNFVTIKQLSQVLNQQLPHAVIGLLSSPGKNELVQQWAMELGNSVVPLLAEKNIQALIENLREADGIISVDTAVVHIAAGLNKPLLAIYSADKKNYAQWRPNSQLAVTMFSESDKDINKFSIQEFERSLKGLKL